MLAEPYKGLHSNKPPEQGARDPSRRAHGLHCPARLPWDHLGPFSWQCLLPAPFPTPLSQALPYSSRLLRPLPPPHFRSPPGDRQWAGSASGGTGRNTVKEKEEVPSGMWLERG